MSYSGILRAMQQMSVKSALKMSKEGSVLHNG